MENDIDNDKRILKRVERYYPTRSFLYECFEKIPSKQVVNKFTSPGTRVLVAKFPDYYKLFLLKYHEPGEKYYPYGGVEVWNANDECKTAFLADSVSIHPIAYLAKVRPIHDKDGNVVDCSIAEKVPITKSDERAVKKLQKREKHMEMVAIREAKLEIKKEKDRVKAEKQQKKDKRHREIDERMRKKESIREQIEKKLDEFIEPITNKYKKQLPKKEKKKKLIKKDVIKKKTKDKVKVKSIISKKQKVARGKRK